MPVSSSVFLKNTLFMYLSLHILEFMWYLHAGIELSHTLLYFIYAV